MHIKLKQDDKYRFNSPEFINNLNCDNMSGARSSIVVKAICYKPEGRGFNTQWGEFLNLPNPLAALGPGVYSASNRNEYQNHKNSNTSVE
jgi:hypothetical protein